ncbi:MAG: gluconate transporter [Proteobacteria bacterium]|nr:MAG: gluconate transporter [Pseudomonadota bacterium]PIE40312.1 MAG: gluconate transporter [Gammaproteobacteria bacterium]
MLILGLCIVIGFIVFSTSKLKWHPFLVLLLAALITAFYYQLPVTDISKTITKGFGGILGYIGLVIVFGTIIGIILEKTGAAIVMAETVIKKIGDRFPTLTMSIVGAIVSVPVFCDSGYVILNSLKESLAKRMEVSSVAMSVALATGLYATHTFVPPTPGPIAAAGNLGLSDSLGWVILLGSIVAIVPILTGWWWANRFVKIAPDGRGAEEELQQTVSREDYGELPSPTMAFLPIVLPIALICVGTIVNFPSHPLGEGSVTHFLSFLGQPFTALLIGVFCAFFLIKGEDKTKQFSDAIAKGLVVAAPILLITGAGGAFGSVLKATPIGQYLGDTLSGLGLGIFMPFIVAAALKTAQGSSTVALVTTSAMIAPLLSSIGLDSDIGRVLCVMAIGSGAMTVSHANDSFFWVVSQFSRMSVSQAYKAQTAATAIQGVSGILFVWILSLVLL